MLYATERQCLCTDWELANLDQTVQPKFLNIVQKELLIVLQLSEIQNVE